MNITWPVYTWDASQHELVDEDGGRFMDTTGSQPQKFGSAEEAEEWLINNDVRGTVV